MSAALMQRVAFRRLEPHLKAVLVALANYAAEDGTGVRPAMTTLAAWTGRSVRRTQLAVAALRDLGLIVPTRGHRPHTPTEYALVLPAIDALPAAQRTGDRRQLELFGGRFPQEIAR